MYTNASTDNHRIITIKSNNPEWTVLLASKLLLGKGKWEVSWAKDVIYVMVADEYLPRLARMLTAPITRYGIEASGDAFYANRTSVWGIWKQDSRFTEMLASHDLLESLQANLLVQLSSSDEFDVSEWVSQEPAFNAVIEAFSHELETEGKVAQKLQACGWV